MRLLFFFKVLPSHSRGLINLTLAIENKTHSEDKHSALKKWFLFGSLLLHVFFLLLLVYRNQTVLNKLKQKTLKCLFFSVTAKWFNFKSSFHSIKVVLTFTVFLLQGQSCQLKKENKLVSGWNWDFFFPHSLLFHKPQRFDNFPHFSTYFNHLRLKNKQTKNPSIVSNVLKLYCKRVDNLQS